MDGHARAQGLTAQTQTTINLLQNTSLGSLAGHTITRTLLTLDIYPAEDEAVNQSAHISYGLLVVHQDTATAGAFPDTDGVPDAAPWLLRDGTVVIKFQGGVLDSREVVRVQYDLSGQRVLRTEQESMYLIFGNESPIDLMDCQYDMNSRILLLAP